MSFDSDALWIVYCSTLSSLLVNGFMIYICVYIYIYIYCCMANLLKYEGLITIESMDED